jgi:acyl-CoA synthetase (NDP forming)/GNAT superfamily N-acetyltransferase
MRSDRADVEGWDALLADGGVVHIRPIVPADAAALRALHRASSDRSIYLRYFSVSRRSGEVYLDRLLGAERVDRLALVAEQGGAAVGMASCERVSGTADAEVALLVADAHQHRGAGTLLLEHLSALARHHGVRRFVGEVLAENTLMQKVFADAGFAVTRSTVQDVIEVSFPIGPTPQLQAAVDGRERAADVRSLRHVLAPRSVAVVGASDRPGSVGGAVLHNLCAGGFAGAVVPVNRRATTVGGLAAFPSVAALPEPVDLAVLAVPAGDVADVVADCGRRGVPATVIVTAGFGETGAGGVGRERELRRLVRRLGIRVVGPNCLGVACTDPDVRLNATFSGAAPVAGALGVASQSGALGIALLAETAHRGLGVSSFVSLGNKLDVSSNDMLLYWEDDPRTRVLALYVESFGNPAKFARHAERIGRRKPIVVLKAGRSAAGAQAGASHTAAAATPDAVVSALLRRAGVIRVTGTAELLDVAALLAEQPLPAGYRLGILGNSGGPGILAADAAAEAGLQVVSLSAPVRAALRAAVPRLAGDGNPVDLGAGAGPEEFDRGMAVLLGSGEVDAVVVIYAELTGGAPAAVAAAIRRAAAAAPGITVAAALLGCAAAGAPTDATSLLPAVPAYQFPEAAVRAIGQAARHAAWRRRPPGTVPWRSDVDLAGARAAVAAALAAHPGGGWLTAEEAACLVGRFGIPVCRTLSAHTADEAVAAAARIGYPVAVKLGGRAVHKSDRGGVRLGLSDQDAVRAAFAAVSAVGESPGDGVVVQPTVQPGLELLVGVNRVDPYPPLVVLGLGGTATELLADRTTRLAPLTYLDATDMLHELRSAPLLTGYRGRPPLAVAAVEDLLLRVGLLADEVPELAELDLNPVIATGSTVTAVDVKVRLAPLPAGEELLSDPLVRRLR